MADHPEQQARATMNLGRQAKTEFDQNVLPDDGRMFTADYNVQHLTSCLLKHCN